MSYVRQNKRCRSRGPNMKRVVARLELIVNVCLIVAGVLLVFTIGRAIIRYKSSQVGRPSSIANGIKLLSSRDWSRSPQTLVLVLSTDCKYCTASAPFYRRVIAQTSSSRHTKLLALFSQSSSEGQKYLHDLEVKIDEVEQMTLRTLGVKGTPTLILVDANGIVIRSWQGLLPREAEDEVLASVK